MVRSGEYSPNYPGNSNVSGGIFGLGEYEEKRKCYNEQRKMEYKEYIAQQAKKNSSQCKGKTQEAFASRGFIENITHSESKTASGQKDVTTQTERCELRDASTSTNQQDRRDKTPECSNGDHKNTAYRKKPSREMNILQTEATMLSNEDSSPRPRHKQAIGVIRKEMAQRDQEGIMFGVNGKRDRGSCTDSPASYERDLRAQIEERRRIKRELEEKERQEAADRDMWLAEEAKKELAKHRTEEERTRVLEDLRKQRMEEFRYRTEELRREAEEMRKNKMRNIAAQSAISVMESDANGAINYQREVSKLYSSKPVSKNASDFGKSAKSRSTTKDSSVQRVSNGISKHTSVSSDEKQGLPTHNMRINEEHLNLSAEKSVGNQSVLTQLGEIRRQLVMEQSRMEEAVQKSNPCN